MRRWFPPPSWVVPSMFVVVSLSAAVGLKVHFDWMLDRVESTAAVATVDSGSDHGRGTLGSEALAEPLAAPDRPSEPPVGPPAGPRIEVRSAVAQAGATDSGDPFWVDPASSGRPWSELGAVEGLLTFRGNPTRTYHGRGPVPTEPDVQWSVELGCSNSPVGGEDKTWCGTGWTGQPAVFRSPSTGEWTVAVGAYDRRVSFFDPESGERTLTPYATGDIIKGSVTIDPDGYPLLYTGSRDNFFHIVALDRTEPTALWRLSSDSSEPTLWNNDWDGSALIVDDHLIVGGENGRFYVVRLNRALDGQGLVTVDPEVVFSAESWDDELLAATGDLEASIEGSVAISGDVVYFANSGGLVQGWRIGGLIEGERPERVFRFWTGDDTDASIVIDGEGMLYVATEFQRGTARGRELGQIAKLDPSTPDDPVVWSRDARAGLGSGVWATPALHQDLVIVAIDDGQVVALDRATGEDRWRLRLAGPLWSSPVVVDGTLIQGDCSGWIRAFALDEPGPEPIERWAVPVDGCVESTPAVWDGRIFVGTRAGTFYAIGD